jgi:ribonuclease P protein component
MTGQNGGSVGASARTSSSVAHSSTSLGRLTERKHFLAVAKGARLHDAAFTLQAKLRDRNMDTQGRRFGLTVTKKTGNSVERNRIRRRLRAALRDPHVTRGTLPECNACDYVIIARRECLSLRFADLTDKLGALVARMDRRLSKSTDTHQA